MHILQPKHTKMSPEDAAKLLQELNISKAQIPKIISTDPALPEGCEPGDILKIERKLSNIKVDSDEDPKKVNVYYRVVV